MTEKLARFAPPGQDQMRLLKYLALAGLIAFFRGLWFFTNFNVGLDNLYDFDNILIPGAMVPAFESMLTLDGFYIFAFSMLGYVGANYLFFCQSKSIYIMKRLRSAFELHLRCWTLPLLGAAAMLAGAAVMYLLCVSSYFINTPAGHIPAQTLLFWRYVP